MVFLLTWQPISSSTQCWVDHAATINWAAMGPVPHRHICSCWLPYGGGCIPKISQGWSWGGSQHVFRGASQLMDPIFFVSQENADVWFLVSSRRVSIQETASQQGPRSSDGIPSRWLTIGACEPSLLVHCVLSSSNVDYCVLSSIKGFKPLTPKKRKNTIVKICEHPTL